MRRCFSQSLINNATRRKQTLKQQDDEVKELFSTHQPQEKEEIINAMSNEAISLMPEINFGGDEEISKPVKRVRKKKEIVFPSEEEIMKTFTIDDVQIDLSEEQKQVVFGDVNDDLLVLACAGSGKTTTIICKIVYMIKYLKIPAHQIMLTTFSRLAANDMKEKLASIGVKSKFTIGTIDAFAYKTLKKYWQYFDSQACVIEYGYRLRNLMKNYPEIADEICKKKKYLIIDEYQDIDNFQAEIFEEFHKRGCKIIAVGDDSQNIYSWRGSSVEHILNFHSKYPNSKLLTLTRNYRSTPEILQVANAILRNNPDNIPKEMTTTRESNLKPIIVNDNQGLYVAKKISEYLKRGVPRERIAILSPTNYGLYKVEEQLSKFFIPHITIMEKSKSLKEMERHTTTGKVCLSTIHKSKGLEWDIVFLVDSSNDKWKGDNDAELRRVLYVAVTRAKDELHIVLPKTATCLSYITEIDRSVFRLHSPTDLRISEQPRSASDSSINPYTVTNMVRNIDGELMTILKEEGCLPQIEFTKTKIVDTDFAYCDVVYENQMFTDFGNFIDTLFCRMISEKIPNGGGFSHTCTELFINEAIVLNTGSIQVFNRYAKKLKQLMRNGKPPKALLKSITDGYEKIVMTEIIESFEKILEKGQFSFEVIPVMTEYAFPPGYVDSLKTAYRIFTNPNYESIDILESVFEISKLDAVVKEGRTRMLYLGNTNLKKKFDFIKDIAPNYTELFNNLQEHFVPFIVEKTESSVNTHRSLSYGKHVTGEADIIIDGETIIDIKCSVSQDIEVEWIIQLLCYAAMARLDGMEIKNIGVINPLRGTYHEVDISWWDQGRSLLDKLYKFTKARVDNQSGPMIVEEEEPIVEGVEEVESDDDL
ncbi:predicted protein [Naegleria gruberi]|uniref:DNA 3'-5' helicase n=1 Tax=Naegleria gruberi TaxID=5762 RepID=D2VVC4_NAEGR|nr:uncharacterized protein NAEGRDRAFT_52552 [Naegleria gruberi]EFC39285.1 predicted protein [Naegleria gruberi]|eukprot:XP_002672029.1 predicted protein [Naegleria gruberi strain NEG-M]